VILGWCSRSTWSSIWTRYFSARAENTNNGRRWGCSFQNVRLLIL